MINQIAVTAPIPSKREWMKSPMLPSPTTTHIVAATAKEHASLAIDVRGIALFVSLDLSRHAKILAYNEN